MPHPRAREARAADFAPIAVDPSMRAVAVTGRAAADLDADAADRLLGTIVHRLMERATDAGDAPAREIAARARALVAEGEAGVFDDVDAAMTAAASTFRALAARDDVKALLASGERLHEVPFSLRRQATSRTGEVLLIRGTIDCLVLRDGEVVVVEFKTGRKRAAHQAQLDVYVEAARALFPDSRVSGVLIYA
jgi:ATP-dependent exoDNAse (exonuclease V) beta subunit